VGVFRPEEYSHPGDAQGIIKMNQSLHSGYKIVHTINDYEPAEKIFLKKWVNGAEYYKTVKRLYYNNKVCDVYESMIKKYDSKYNKNETIYRGMRFLKSEQEQKDKFNEIKDYFSYHYKNGMKCKIDYSPASYTLSKIIAQYFAKFNDPRYCSLLFQLITRKRNEIDACTNEVAIKSVLAGENELILPSHHCEYVVDDMIFYDDDMIIVTIKET